MSARCPCGTKIYAPQTRCPMCEEMSSTDEAVSDKAKLAKAEAEVTRLRAALESIAALQTEEPFPDPGKSDFALWQERGRYEAAEMARAGLVGK